MFPRFDDDGFRVMSSVPANLALQTILKLAYSGGHSQTSYSKVRHMNFKRELPSNRSDNGNSNSIIEVGDCKGHPKFWGWDLNIKLEKNCPRSKSDRPH